MYVYIYIYMTYFAQMSKRKDTKRCYARGARFQEVWSRVMAHAADRFRAFWRMAPVLTYPYYRSILERRTKDTHASTRINASRRVREYICKQHDKSTMTPSSCRVRVVSSCLMKKADKTRSHFGSLVWLPGVYCVLLYIRFPEFMPYPIGLCYMHG